MPRPSRLERFIDRFSNIHLDWLFCFDNEGTQTSAEFYAESQSIMAMSYARARTYYERDLYYEDRYRMAYATRNDATRWVAFAIIVIAISALAFFLVFRATDDWDSFLVIPLVWLVALLARLLYYQKIGYELVHTSNRINAFLSRTDIDASGNYAPQNGIDFDRRTMAEHESAQKIEDRIRNSIRQQFEANADEVPPQIPIIIEGIIRGNAAEEAGIEDVQQPKTHPAVGSESETSILQPEDAPQTGETEAASEIHEETAQIQPEPVLVEPTTIPEPEPEPELQSELKPELEVQPESAPIPTPADVPSERSYMDYTEEEFDRMLEDYLKEHGSFSLGE